MEGPPAVSGRPSLLRPAPHRPGKGSQQMLDHISLGDKATVTPCKAPLPATKAPESQQRALWLERGPRDDLREPPDPHRVRACASWGGALGDSHKTVLVLCDPSTTSVFILSQSSPSSLQPPLLCLCAS